MVLVSQAQIKLYPHQSNGNSLFHITLPYFGLGIWNSLWEDKKRLVSQNTWNHATSSLFIMGRGTCCLPWATVVKTRVTLFQYFMIHICFLSKAYQFLGYLFCTKCYIFHKIIHHKKIFFWLTQFNQYFQK